MRDGIVTCNFQLNKGVKLLLGSGKMMKRLDKINGLPVAVMMSFVLFACGGGKKQEQMPPMAVSVLEVTPQEVPITLDAPGQTVGSREVEVRSRASGILLRRTYTEGRPVKEGDALFKIDSQSTKAAVDAAKATLSVQQAAALQAKQNYDRILPLYKQNAVSRRDRDDAVAAYNSAKASVEAAQAQLRSAQINLNYSTVSAPISGVTSSEVRSEGSLISPQDILTKITQLNPMYVNFSYSDNDMLQLRKDQQEGRIRLPNDNLFDVVVLLPDGSEYPIKGKMSFTDSVVSPTTGTIRARATFANPENALLPGLFVRVVLKGAVRTNAILIPQRAILSGPQGKTVWVVTGDNTVEQRPVKTADTVDKNIIVVDGLKAGDKVILDNTMKLFQMPPGSKVDPKSTTLEQFYKPAPPAAPAQPEANPAKS